DLVHYGGAGRLERPQVDGDAGEGQAVVGDLLLELLPARPGRVRHRAGVRAEAAQLHPVVPEVLELVQDDVEVAGRLLLVEQVRPGADRDAGLGHDSLTSRENGRGLPVIRGEAPGNAAGPVTDLDSGPPVHYLSFPPPNRARWRPTAV